MNVLVLGQGGREHAIVTFLTQSPKVKKIWFSPGNAGKSKKSERIKLNINYPYREVIDFSKTNHISLVVVGPENYLVDGIVDILEKENIDVFGPCKNAAKLEGSKIYAKEVMKSAKIPTSDSFIAENIESALDYIINQAKPPYVLKADGLAAGKGVFITDTIEKSKLALENFFIKKLFGNSGSKILIESFLPGEELSVLAFTDGKSIKCLPASQDHKRLLEGDKGNNTGGMGVYTPVSIYNKNLEKKIIEKIISPTLKELSKNNITYKGVLYVGLMIYKNNPYVVEFNCRLGDPEAQCVLPLLKTDLLEILLACSKGNLDEINFEYYKKSVCNVVMVSGGYPEKYQNGFPIKGLAKIQKEKDIFIFHAGTKLNSSKKEIITSGGRVLSVSALSKSIEEARHKAYNAISKISFNHAYYRKDIAYKELNRTLLP